MPEMNTSLGDLWWLKPSWTESNSSMQLFAMAQQRQQQNQQMMMDVANYRLREKQLAVNTRGQLIQNSLSQLELDDATEWQNYNHAKATGAEYEPQFKSARSIEQFRLLKNQDEVLSGQKAARDNLDDQEKETLKYAPDALPYLNAQKRYSPQWMDTLSHWGEVARTNRQKQTQPLEFERLMSHAEEEEGLAQKALQAGDTTTYQYHTSRAKEFRDKMASGKTSTKVYDAQGNLIMDQSTGAAAEQTMGGATPATRTLVEEQNLRYDNAITLISQLQSGLRPQDVGPSGVMGEAIFDVGIPAVRAFFPGIPETSDPVRISNRAAIGMLRESLLKPIAEGGVRNKLDREEITRLLPRDGVWESYDRAMGSLSKVREILADRSADAASHIGAPKPAYAKTAEQMQADYNAKIAAIKQFVEQKRLTPKEAKAQVDELAAKTQADLKKYWNIDVNFK